jgi:hypothetical protein
MSEFNASISATELLTKTLENMAKELAIRCITECASMYKFDAVEAIMALGLQNLSLTRKPMHKKPVDETIDSTTIATKAAKAVKPVKPIKESKPTFPFPFEPSRVNESGCQGLSYNHGLFTQCVKSCMSNGSFCKSCQTEADNSSTGRPDCGTITQRIDTELYEFKDSKGRSPISYVKFLEKTNFTAEQAVEEAGKLEFIISECHFVKKQINKDDAITRGRPKKISTIVQAETVDDMFANLECDEIIADDDEEDDDDDEVAKEVVAVVEQVAKEAVAVVEQVENNDKTVKKAAFEAEREARREAKRTESKQNKSDENVIEKKLAEAKKLELEIEKETKKLAVETEKEAKKLAVEAEKEAKKLAVEAEKEAKKLAVEAEKEAKKLAVEAEKEAKKLAVEAEKEAKKQALEDKKLAVEADKEAKKQALEDKKLAVEAEKEAKKQALEDKKLAVEAEKEAKKQALEDKKLVIESKKQALEQKKGTLGVKKVDVPIEAEVVSDSDMRVKKITIDGIQYLKAKETDIVYTLEQEEIGIWNRETGQIDPLPKSDDSEEEEDEYEYEDEEDN